MIAIDRYKDMIDEVGRMLSIFANYEGNMTLQRWTIDTIHNTQLKVMDYAGVAVAQIKRELVGDGKEAEYRGRLRTAFFELCEDPNFTPSYFPVFDEAIFEIPSKDNSDNNRQMLNALTAIFGEGNAADVMVSLQTTAQWANVIVGDVSKMLDSICKFVGYTPEPQKEPQETTEIELQPSTRQEPQRAEQGQKKDLHYYCQKAIEKGYFEKVGDGYRIKDRKWTKAQLAYFLGHFLKEDRTFPDKEYCLMFGETRLSKELNRLVLNKTGDGKPRGYEIVNELLQE